MKAGDVVRVYPHGAPEQAAEATVLLSTPTRRAVILAFADKPPFALNEARGLTIHPESGIVMLAARALLDGVPWGPWVETFGGGHYEIEEAG